MSTPLRSLAEYRASLEVFGGGTVPYDRVLEIIRAAEQEIATARGEYTVSRAVEVSGRSRAWFKRRLPRWSAEGKARQLDNGQWLIRIDAVPRRGPESGAGLDLSRSDEDLIADLLPVRKAS